MRINAFAGKTIGPALESGSPPPRFKLPDWLPSLSFTNWQLGCGRIVNIRLAWCDYFAVLALYFSPPDQNPKGRST